MTKLFSFSTQRMWHLWLASLLGGVAAGALLNVAEAFGVPGASDFGNYFGLWIFLITIIAAWSVTWQRAALYVVTFLMGMITTYYLSTWLINGYFLAHLLWGWAAVTFVLAAPFAVFTWRARGSGWLAAAAAGLPIGLLIYEAYLMTLVPGRGDQLVFDLTAASILLFILPSDLKQRWRMALFVPIFAFAAKLLYEDLLPFATQFI